MEGFKIGSLGGGFFLSYHWGLKLEKWVDEETEIEDICRP